MVMNEYYRILVIDDDTYIRDMLEEFLKGKGYDVETISNGHDAIEIIKTKAFDVIMVDLKMPGMSGIEILSMAKRLEPDAMVIIMTGYASLDTAIQAIRQGAYDYITKPFQLEEVCIAIRNVCEKVSLKRQQKVFIDELRKMRTSADKSQTAPDIQTVDTKSYDKEIIDELERLAGLVTRGMLTKEEYEILKKRYLKETAA